MDNVLSHFLRIFHKRRNPLIWRIPFIKTCQAISIRVCVIVYIVFFSFSFSFFFCFLTPFAGVKVFFFLVHLCSSLQGTLHNLYSLLFFLVNTEDNVSFRLWGGTWDDLHLVLFYVKNLFGLFLVIFVFVFVFSPIFKKKKKSVALARVLSQSSLCYFYL